MEFHVDFQDQKSFFKTVFKSETLCKSMMMRNDDIVDYQW